MVDSVVPAINNFCANYPDVDVVICPPFPYLMKAAELITHSNVQLGAQTSAQHHSGAYTGEVSPPMLAEFGCKYVIVGHSERREYYGETNEIVAQKVIQIQSAGLLPILCVGETLEQREKGVVQETIISQVNAVIEKIGIEALRNAVIAYEPVWAIGTGKTATPDQAQQAHAMIRAEVACQSPAIADQISILYGGSMKPANASELLVQKDIDGGLIGGSSLDAKQFNAIISAVS